MKKRYKARVRRSQVVTITWEEVVVVDAHTKAAAAFAAESETGIRLASPGVRSVKVVSETLSVEKL